MELEKNNIEAGGIWKSPLPNCTWSLPLGKYLEAGFGAKRKYSLHTGVDLFCEHLQPLASVENGTVVAIEDFSKKKVWVEDIIIHIGHGNDRPYHAD